MSAVPAGSGLREMHPAYFAMAMATGIVSIAAQVHELFAVARALLAVNLVAYPTLWLLTLLRLARHADAVRQDLLSHGRSVGFFTMVPATTVLGSQCLLVGGYREVALGFWLLGLLLLAVLTYGILAILTVKEVKPPLDEGLHGGWLLAVVAMQSVAVLGAQLAPDLGPQMLLLPLVAWLAGGMLYIWIISLIFYRYTFFSLSPSDLTPPYWVNMGAVAISTLAGTTLAAAAPHAPLLAELLPFIKGMTLFWWATATWWIPMLLILGAWRHLYRRFPIAYDPLYWGAVFPLGMYATCTARLSTLIESPPLASIAGVFLWVALATWLALFAALILRLCRALPSLFQ